MFFPKKQAIVELLLAKSLPVAVFDDRCGKVWEGEA